MSFAHWLEDHFLTCPIKEDTGLDCPGCGLQRSFVALLEGDMAGSIAMYPALLPMLLMLVVLVAHLIFKFQHGATWLKGLFIFNVVVIVINYVLKFVV